MTLRFKAISGAIPATLGESVSFNFDLDGAPRGVGILFYMVDTGEGNHAYRVKVNGNDQSAIVLPPGREFATLHTGVAQLHKSNNVLSFESDGTGPPVDILNVALFYEA
jgi:hypothetical protein